MPWRLKSCPRCRGDLISEDCTYAIVWSCIQCGYEGGSMCSPALKIKIDGRRRENREMMDLERGHPRNSSARKTPAGPWWLELL